MPLWCAGILPREGDGTVSRQVGEVPQDSLGKAYSILHQHTVYNSALKQRQVPTQSLQGSANLTSPVKMPAKACKVPKQTRCCQGGVFTFGSPCAFQAPS